MYKEECLLTFSSTHAAISAEECLVNGRFSVRVMAKPDTLGAGCGLCLRLEPKQKLAACALLSEQEVPIENIYLAKKSGHKTEYLPWEN